MTLSFVLGTAAELIKIYPLIIEAKKRGAKIRVVMSGQSHENFLMQYRDFGLFQADLVEAVRGNDLRQARGALRWFLRALFLRRPPLEGRVVVHGDTLTSLIGAFWGWRMNLEVAHVEAGLRSPKIFDPFPEEICRRLVTHFARLHFAPDAKAAANLKGAKGVVVTTGGNTLIDAVRLCAEDRGGYALRYAVSNVHRFENLNSPERFLKIVNAVTRAADKIHLIFVAHPQTLHKLEHDPRAAAIREHKNIEIRERMPFQAFIKLLKGAEYLISDGGSNQEECSYLGKPCLLLRETSERFEGLDTCCVLSRFDGKIIEDFLMDPAKYAADPMPDESSPSSKILDVLLGNSVSV